MICAARFLAAVGEIGRFSNPRALVGCLGLDPRVYQSGSAPAKGGHISKQGSASARWARGERTGTWATRQAMREGERRLAEQAEASYARAFQTGARLHHRRGARA